MTRPANPPLVSSTDYPDDGTVHGGQGIPGVFTFSANRDADVVGFRYGWSGTAGDYVAADQSVVVYSRPATAHSPTGTSTTLSSAGR